MYRAEYRIIDRNGQPFGSWPLSLGQAKRRSAIWGTAARRLQIREASDWRDVGLDPSAASEVDGHWRVVLDIDQVTSVPIPEGVIAEFCTELLDFLADRLRTTGSTTLEWMPDVSIPEVETSRRGVL